MKKLFALLMLIPSLALAADNSFIFEPFVGYDFSSTFRMKLPQETQNLRGSGTALGAKVGYQILEWQFMFEYFRSSLDTNDNTVKKNIDTNEYSFLVGYNYHDRWRPYLGYIFTANARTELSLDNDNSVGFHADVGSGYKAGISYTVSKYVYVNAEYRVLNFNKVRADGENVSSQTSASSYLLSLSTPFQLWY